MAARGSRKTARQTYTKPRKKRVNSSKKNADKLKHEAVGENFLASEILIIFVFLVSILLFIGNLGLGGAVGNLFKGFQLGLFGVAGYLFPAVFLVSTAFLISNKGSLASNIKVAACIGRSIYFYNWRIFVKQILQNTGYIFLNCNFTVTH